MSRAIGMIETIGIGTNIEATDAMLKVADVKVIKQNKRDPALVTTFIEGDVAGVKIALESARKVAIGKGSLVACTVIPAADIDTVETLVFEASREV